jgi:hypothetical protein
MPPGNDAAYHHRQQSGPQVPCPTLDPNRGLAYCPYFLGNQSKLLIDYRCGIDHIQILFIFKAVAQLPYVNVGQVQEVGLGAGKA